MFGHDWQPGEGELVDVRVISRSGSGAHAHIRRGFLMDIRPSSGEPFRTEIPEPEWTSFIPPSVPGEVVKVRCDPARKEARFDTHAQKEEKRAARQADAERYEAERQAGFGSGTVEAKIDRSDR
jgi:hypothetical protein